MAGMTPLEFARKVGSGLLSFPVTCFNTDLSFNENAFQELVALVNAASRRRASPRQALAGRGTEGEAA